MIVAKLLSYCLVVALSCGGLSDWYSGRAVADVWWAKPGQKFFIQGLGSCSVGFPAWDNAGNHYFISAAHCFRDHAGRQLTDHGYGLKVLDPYKGNMEVGYEHVYPSGGPHGYIDISVVQMFPGRGLSGPGWNGINTTPVTAKVGDTACIAGWRSFKRRCGAVEEVNVPANPDGLNLTSIVDYATYCFWHGDSGGAVYNDSGALGIGITLSLAFNNDESCSQGHSGFIAINYILDTIRGNRHYAIPSLTIH